MIKKNQLKRYVKLGTIAMVAGSATSAIAHPTLTFDKASIPTRYIVKFKQDEQPFSMANNPFWGPRIGQQALLSQIQASDIEPIGHDALYSAKLAEERVEALRSRPDIEYVEIDPPRFLMSETTPWGYFAVKADQLEDSQAGNQTICIIDSGYDLAHNDLSGNRVTGTNDRGTGQWYIPGSNNAHGTHVAGTIAAIANNEGVKGLLPNQNVNLHIVKVFNESGWGYSSTLVRAIQTCADNGAKIVNMSLGGSQSSRTEQNAMDALYERGVLMIAAAGNSGNTAHSYPASYDSVMSVAAVDSNYDHASFSQATNQVEIAAPGVAVLSTVSVGEGVLSTIITEDRDYFRRGVVPHNRLNNNGFGFESAPIAGQYTAPLALCDTSSGRYQCGDMRGKICLTERIANETPSVRPEINAVAACNNAGALAAMVYSNQQRPGLQNPFVLDQFNTYPLLSVSVNRNVGQELAALVGQDITVSTRTGEDYQYYNGTSMATPHVSGVAGLVWSYHPQCSAKQIRQALTQTALDLDVLARYIVLDGIVTSWRKILTGQ
uniref:Alkaline serine protease (VapT) n=1 Tax=Vibrio metschnikovii TaxID=28172 RepID=Q56700_VIBME|nr:alkaline serine protease (VapT) [Vibrio metschnikovii]